MSSHHFVRDGQEPALLILEPVPFSLAGPLLEWAPLTLVSAKALDEVLAWQIKIDVALSTPHQEETTKEKLLVQAPVKVLSADDDLSTALYFLIATKQQAVSVLVHDPTIWFEKLTGFMDKLTINLLSETMRWSAIHSGVFKKWLPGGSTLQFNGLPDEHLPAFLQRSGPGYSIAGDHLIEIKSSNAFWVGEPW